MPTASTTSGWTTSSAPAAERVEQLRRGAGHLTAGHPDPGLLPEHPHARQVSPAGSGSSSHSTPRSCSSPASAADRGDVERGRDVAGHPPPLVQVDHDLDLVTGGLPGGPDRGQARRRRRRGRSGSSPRGTPPRGRRAPPRPAAPGRWPRRTTRTPGCCVSAPPNRAATGSPATLPAMSHSAASSGQYRPAWKLMVSSVRTWLAIWRGVPAEEQVLVGRRSRPWCRRSRSPVTPSSVSTRTRVASKAAAAPDPRRRGTAGPAAAASGRAGSQ